ncbi:Tc5 transposase DNA-binding domain [Phytophthora infestans]|uniref:Tc5 transposase DNA-binding domain n=1 Tax=Phytophthora infestans TaxID=4787 RepID=A0A833TFN4_PHYIN|nr:Tc5 transposase DNA-binding domain [Phytophthora infestans]KAF4130159.1 Tc5 transposase DNA-binding domain [Phytophthora infestans]
MGPRGAGRRLNDQERMEILEIIQREAKVKNVDLAKRYGVSEGAIRKLKQMKDTIRNRYYMGNEHNRDKRKRGGFKRNAPFEEELYQWIVRMRESQPYQLMPLTQTAVRQQAIILSKNYEKMANFKASPGWFARFCSRHRLDPIVANVVAGGDTASTTMGSAPGDVSLSADGVPQAVTMPPAVSMPMTTGATDETAFLMDSLTAAPSQEMEMVNATDTIATDAEESKTGTASINEQVQQAAREHNEAALRAAAAKIGEAQATSEDKMADAEPEASDTESVKKEDVGGEEEEQTKKEGDATADVAEDEIFSLGL